MHTKTMLISMQRKCFADLKDDSRFVDQRERAESPFGSAPLSLSLFLGYLLGKKPESWKIIFK